MEMESTEVVLFVLMLYSFVTSLMRPEPEPEPEPIWRSTQIRSRHTSNAIMAKFLQHQKAVSKAFGLRKRIG